MYICFAFYERFAFYALFVTIKEHSISNFKYIKNFIRFIVNILILITYIPNK